jgi:hypothetical protein
MPLRQLHDGKLDGEVEARASSCSQLHTASSLHTEHETAKVGSVADFFYDDSNAPYTPLPEHDLDYSPCCPIIAIKEGYFYCRLHPDVQNIHLESVEHHIRYKDPDKHRLELLKLSKLNHD